MTRVLGSFNVCCMLKKYVENGIREKSGHKSSVSVLLEFVDYSSTPSTRSHCFTSNAKKGGILSTELMCVCVGFTEFHNITPLTTTLAWIFVYSFDWNLLAYFSASSTCSHPLKSNVAIVTGAKKGCLGLAFTMDGGDMLHVQSCILQHRHTGHACYK